MKIILATLLFALISGQAFASNSLYRSTTSNCELLISDSLKRAVLVLTNKNGEAYSLVPASDESGLELLTAENTYETTFSITKLRVIIKMFNGAPIEAKEIQTTQKLLGQATKNIKKCTDLALIY